MDLLVVGSAAFDSVKTPVGEVEDVLGGSAFYFAAAASYFVRVRLVAVVGEDFPTQDLAFLKARSVDLEGLAVVPGRTFRWAGEYQANFIDRQTLDTQLNVFASFRPRLPDVCRETPYVFLANIDPELQLQVLNQIHKPKFVACDTMDFWIRGKREALLELLRRVDLLVINDAEARQLSGEYNLLKAAWSILSLGPRLVILKKGEHGAMLVAADGCVVLPAFPLAEICDPTGAGDSFAGGLMGYLARHQDLSNKGLARALVYGTIMASFSVEDFSMRRLEALSEQEINDRLQQFLSMLRV